MGGRYPDPLRILFSSKLAPAHLDEVEATGFKSSPHWSRGRTQFLSMLWVGSGASAAVPPVGLNTQGPPSGVAQPIMQLARQPGNG